MAQQKEITRLHTSFIESEERQGAAQGGGFAANYGHEAHSDKARKHEHTSELWAKAGKLTFWGESALKSTAAGRRRHVRTVAGDGGRWPPPARRCC